MCRLHPGGWGGRESPLPLERDSVLLLSPAGHDQTAKPRGSPSATAAHAKSPPSAAHRAIGPSPWGGAQAGGTEWALLFIFLFLLFLFLFYLFIYSFILIFFSFFPGKPSPPTLYASPSCCRYLLSSFCCPSPTGQQGKLLVPLLPQFPCLSFPIQWGAEISPSGRGLLQVVL